MPESDRARWDRKYTAGEGPVHFEPSALVTSFRPLLRGGRALDVACGFGGNALFLASLGYRVDAIDVSGVALARARAEALRRGLPINLVQADATSWWVPPRTYDAIVTTFYLDRALIPRLAAGLRPQGLYIQAARNIRYRDLRPSFNPAFMVELGELAELAVRAGLEVIYYVDGIPGEAYSSYMVARR